MRTWLVKDARARFGDVVSNALAGEPQRIARRGREAVVVVSEAEWERLQAAKPTLSFGEVLAQFPLTHEEWREVAPGPLPLRSRRRPDAA